MPPHPAKAAPAKRGKTRKPDASPLPPLATTSPRQSRPRRYRDDLAPTEPTSPRQSRPRPDRADLAATEPTSPRQSRPRRDRADLAATEPTSPRQSRPRRDRADLAATEPTEHCAPLVQSVEASQHACGSRGDAQPIRAEDEVVDALEWRNGRDLASVADEHEAWVSCEALLSGVELRYGLTVGTPLG